MSLTEKIYSEDVLLAVGVILLLLSYYLKHVYVLRMFLYLLQSVCFRRWMAGHSDISTRMFVHVEAGDDDARRLKE